MASKFSLPGATSLSARLLVLTVFFVMVSEVLIFAPSIARFRLTYLQERLAAAHLAVLALEATPNHMVSDDLERELLNTAGAALIGLKKPNGIKLMLAIDEPPRVDLTVNLYETGPLGLIRDALATLASKGNRLMRVLGPSPKNPEIMVEAVIGEAPLRIAMLEYANRILGLSIVISLITAALVYVSLQWLMVRPMRRITQSMIAFREDPEDTSRSVSQSTRTDEIGIAERELAGMQSRLRAALHQKTHLAALGSAMSKINHDLRGILATARLVSDRLAASGDPEVRRVTPVLLGAIDRAVDLCTKTLAFAQEGPASVNRARFALATLIEEVGASLEAETGGWLVDVPQSIIVFADRDQLYRVFMNLARNAFQAGASRMVIRAEAEADRVIIDFTDNGPGLPPRARELLFQPFAGSARPGGTGLGLAISRELMHAHGGEIELVSSDAEGTRFRLTLPMRGGVAQRVA